MKIAIAGDHAGPSLRALIKDTLSEAGYDCVDLGADGDSSVDYPDYAHKLAAYLKDYPDAVGVLVCGTGLGISMAANRHSHLRAALCHDTTTARLSRQHNNANVLVLGARIVGPEVALDCLNVFLNTEFEGGRHSRRVDKITPAD